MKFKYKIFLGLLIINFFITGATGSYFYIQSKEALYRTIKKELLAISQIASKIIPGDLLEKLTKPQDMNTPEYKKIQDIISKIENSNDEILYVYTMRLEGSKVTFIVDSPPSDDNHDGKITEDEIPYSIGDEYKNPPKSLLLGFIKPTTDERPVKDELGWTMSGYSPIYNSKGERIGLVGADMSLEKIHNKMELIKKAGIISLLISIILSILLSLYFGEKFIQPLNLLRNSFRELSKGKLKHIDLERTDEIGELFRDFNKMVTELKEKNILRSFLGKMVDPDIVKGLIKNSPRVNGVITEAVVVFCDIRNFTTLCSNLPPTSVIAILNQYFTEMVEVINNWGGYVDKFLGDGMLVVFGHPKKTTNPQDSAIQAALEMIDTCKVLNKKLVLKNHAITNAIGIHFGPIVSGLVGSDERVEYTVLGDTVNIAQRLEKINRKLNTKISISKEVYNKLNAKLKPKFRNMGKHQIKGKPDPIEVYSYTETKKTA